MNSIQLKRMNWIEGDERVGMIVVGMLCGVEIATNLQFKRTTVHGFKLVAMFWLGLTQVGWTAVMQDVRAKRK